MYDKTITHNKTKNMNRLQDKDPPKSSYFFIITLYMFVLLMLMQFLVFIFQKM